MCVFYTFLLPASVFAATEKNDSDLKMLRAGGVVVEEIRQGASDGAVRISILIQAPAEHIWNVISQCSQAYRYLEGLQACEILVDEPERALTRHVLDTGVMAPELDYTFETLRHPFHRMDVVLVAGNLRRMEGYWQFLPFESGVLLEHEILIRPKTPAPRWLVRKKLNKDLPKMMLCIRGLAGGSPNAEAERADLAACQESESVQGQ